MWSPALKPPSGPLIGARPFREGCLLAVNLGDDADTTGAVFGQLAGAYYGAEGISPEWLERIAMWV